MLVVLLLGVSFLHIYQSFIVGRKAFECEDLSGGVAIIIRLMRTLALTKEQRELENSTHGFSIFQDRRVLAA